jgi:hypothetical protein
VNAVRKQPSWRDHHGTEEPRGWSQEEREQFADWIISFQKRPWDWVLECYPWGEPGSPLENRMPELWQRKVLLDLQEELSKLDLSAKDVLKHVIRISVAAGNGVGKTALMAMIIHWFASVFPHGEGVCTAGTGDQLSGKLWRELAKWQPLAINGWMMEWAPERYKVRGAQQTWFIEARTWSVANPDAMAGTHGNTC